METVKFRILELCDSPKQGSDIKLNGEYIGKLSISGIHVYYTDSVDTDWVFWIDDTCELIAPAPVLMETNECIKPQ